MSDRASLADTLLNLALTGHSVMVVRDHIADSDERRTPVLRVNVTHGTMIKDFIIKPDVVSDGLLTDLLILAGMKIAAKRARTKQ